MSVVRKIGLLSKISIVKFIYYNFLCSKVERRGKGFLLPYKNAVIDLYENSKIVLYDGHFHVNYYAPRGSHAEAYLKMLEGSKLEVYGSVRLCYKATIEIHKDAKVEIGSAYINSDSVILANKHISIGNDTMFARAVFVFDSDHHDILNADGNKTNLDRDVIIGNHVWCGLKATILKGSKILDGAVIAPHSLVGCKVKSGVMVWGNPARPFCEVNWRG